jgi:hypothetical protein
MTEDELFATAELFVVAKELGGWEVPQGQGNEDLAPGGLP